MPTREFQPSTESMTPAERTLAMLNYIRKAADVLEKHLQDKGELPPWVMDKMLVSAQNMGMSVSFIRRASAGKVQPAEKPKAKKSRGVA